MKLVKIIALICLIAMSLGLANGFINGNFFEDGGELFANPWGVMSIIDLYVGFVLFSVWIVFREKSVLLSIFWVVFMMILGFFTAALYILIAASKSNDDWIEFFFGNRKDILNN